MPKLSNPPVPGQKRRRKRKPGRPKGYVVKKKAKFDNDGVFTNKSDIESRGFQEDEDSITAQTATNLKAFRFLFGSHQETDEEFEGYYPREIADIQAKSKRRKREIKKEIAYIESTIKELEAVDTRTSLCYSSVKSSCFQANRKSPPTPSSVVIQPSVSVVDPSHTSALLSTDLKFPGFDLAESHHLQADCRAKSDQLFELSNSVESQVDWLNTDNRPESTAETPMPREDGDLKEPAHLKSPARNGLKDGKRSCRSIRKNFVPTHAIGEITVTPILQTDIPITVNLPNSHGTPFRIGCLPKT